MPETPSCDSCGATADVELRDGSTWCRDCDNAARRLDDESEPITRVFQHPIGIKWPADGTLSPPIYGDGSGTALPPVDRPEERNDEQ